MFTTIAANTSDENKQSAIKLLREALESATEAGLLDDLAKNLHPDAINSFCDAVDSL